MKQQQLPVLRIRIRLDPFHDTDPVSKKSAKIKFPQKSSEYHTFFFKNIKFMFNGHKIYPMNNTKQIIFWRNIFLMEKEVKINLVFSRGSDSDPLFQETDPRIRIPIKMKRILDTDSYICPTSQEISPEPDIRISMATTFDINMHYVYKLLSRTPGLGSTHRVWRV